MMEWLKKCKWAARNTNPNVAKQSLPTDRRAQDGEALSEEHQQIQRLSFALTQAENRARRQIALELHDLIAQSLSMAKLRLQRALSSLSGNGPTPAENDLTYAIALVDHAIQSSRNLIYELDPPMLAQLGLETALAWLADEYSEKHNFAVQFEDDHSIKMLNEALAMLMFRAARELLTNIVKHAHAKTVKLTLWQDADYVHMAAEDDGIGCAEDPFKKSHNTTAFGLYSIRERFNLIGGYVKFQSRPAAGTRVELAIPTRLALD